MKKLKVVNERAQKEIEREAAQDDSHNESDYWEENEKECDQDKELHVLSAILNKTF